jgi:hypothetical protein
MQERAPTGGGGDVRARSRSLQPNSAASKAIEEAKRLHMEAGATATTKEWQVWCRQVPLQVQSLIDALVSPPSYLNDERRDARHHPEIKFVPRAAQYIATDSLVFSVIFLGRYLAGLPPAEQAQQLLPQQMLLLFATCMVLADKFSNDDAYDDLLPAVGIVTGIQPKVLRKKEVEILGSLLNTSSMFVAEVCFFYNSPFNVPRLAARRRTGMT